MDFFFIKCAWVKTVPLKFSGAKDPVYLNVEVQLQRGFDPTVWAGCSSHFVSPLTFYPTFASLYFDYLSEFWIWKDLIKENETSYFIMLQDLNDNQWTMKETIFDSFD